MQKEKFQDYLYNPESYKNADLSELKELCHEFPWFSSAAIILLHCSNIQEDPDFSILLKKHSIYIPNRKVVHKLMQSGSQSKTQKNDFLIEETNSQELRSRIPGIFDSPEDNEPSNDIQKEISNNSVLDDESLLEFSYSSPKTESGNSVINSAEITESKEILNFNQLEEEIPDRTPGDKGKNFDHWISKMIDQPENEEIPGKKFEIIESFIQSDPGVIRADKETRLQGDVSKGSAEENEGFITDTLARIYIKQGLYNKAIYAYEKLCLKYPEKSIYFVTQIEEIKSHFLKK